MSKNLALSLIGPGRSANTVSHGDKLRIECTDPPDTADDVVIRIRDLTHVVRGSKHFGLSELARFRGTIRGGKFQLSSSTGIPLTDPGHPKLREMHITLVAPDGVSERAVRLPDFSAGCRMAISHRLKWNCEAKILGKPASLAGVASTRAVYKQAMIVPTGNAPQLTHPDSSRDPSLPMIHKWAQQWQSHQPKLRKVFPLTTVTVNPYGRALTDADYAPLLSVMGQAAAFAPHGIIALAVGHGSAGASTPGAASDPWLDIVAEDGIALDDQDHMVGVYHRLLVNQQELNDMKGQTFSWGHQFATGDTLIKQHALDGMRRIFHDHPIRMLVLHTCSAGSNTAFTDNLRDRLQLHLRAHTASIEYTGFVASTIHATYAGEAQTPESTHEWPTRWLAAESTPGPIPPSPPPPGP